MKRPPRPTHSYLTDTEVRTLDVLVRRGARALRPEECNKLISLFQHHIGDLQQARRANAGLRGEVNRLRNDLRAAEDELQERRTRTPLICCDERHQQKVEELTTALAEGRQRITAAKRYARALQRLGTNGEAGIAQNVLLKLGVPLEEAAAPQKASRPAATLPTEPGNAEDCPQCGERRDLPYPFLCPGHPAEPAA